MIHLGLALKLLWRDWRSGELTLLLASLVIAISTVTTITLFVDRLQQALLLESASFLAADVVISSSAPIRPELLEYATKLGLEKAETLSFLSMVFSAERAQFSSVKAVDGNYPLRGKLIVSDEPFVGGAVSDGGPLPGQVWLESRLFPSLDVKRGEVLDVGISGLIASQVLIKEPDKGGGFDATGPRVLMNMKDVEATGVVQPGSRLTYRYLFAGSAPLIEEFSAWAKPRLNENSRLIGVKEGTQGIGNALNRAERFLLLGGLLGVILAGVAIALSAQRYSLRHYDHVAILKTLGASPNTIDGLFASIFVVLGCVATLVGTLLGFLFQQGAVTILGPYIPIALPAPTFAPIILGMVTGFVCLLSFALPPLLKLRGIEPIRVIRRDFEGGGASDKLSYVAAVVGTLGLMWWYSKNLELTLMIFAGGFCALVVLALLSMTLLKSGRVLGMQAGSAWRLALGGMQRRAKENTMQIMVFGLAIMLLLILFLVRTALLDDWKAQIPEGAPNHFAINIAPEDVEPIEAMMRTNSIDPQPIYPMIRGRISFVNGVPAATRDEAQRNRSDEEQQRGPRSNSGRNLTWSGTLPVDNTITSGQWWGDDYSGPSLVSIEKDLALTNDLKVGDALVFNIQGRELPAKVASIRSVSWDNMRPNFYIIFSPGSLSEFPSTFMTSFYLAKDQKLLLNDVLREFPTMTVIEVDAVIEQIQIIISQVTLAVELVLGLIMVSGAMVLLSSIQASMDERFKQHAILRTLGASRKLVLGSLIIEFCALGTMAGILATFGSELTVYGLETQIFELEYSFNPQIWVLGPLVGCVLIGVLGTLATRKVVNTPPIVVLRDSV
ncbi:MAG: putative ABC transport system permease protein [Candidatus Azotimanducaceae bacterium]